MQIILQKNIKNLGKKSTLVDVKPGYGRNYLIPKGYAIVANKKNLAIFQENQRQIGEKQLKIKQSAEKIERKLDGLIVSLPTRAGKNERIYGSITPLQLSEALKKCNIHVEKKQITLDTTNIKTLGTYEAKIQLHQDIVKKIQFKVVSE